MITSDGHGEGDKHTIAVSVTTTPTLALFVQSLAAFGSNMSSVGESSGLAQVAHQLELAAHH